jgi:hypothetical protein
LQRQAKEASELWRKLKLDTDGTGDGGPPDLQTLWTAVQEAGVQWDKKRENGFSKAKAQLFSFLDTMEAYSSLFSVIPDGEWYSSLLTGVVSSVVKVNPT